MEEMKAEEAAETGATDAAPDQQGKAAAGAQGGSEDLGVADMDASTQELARETLGKAEAEAQRIREEALDVKQRMVAEVRGHIETILSVAKEEAARLITEARQKADEEATATVARARSEAERLIKEAAGRAGASQADRTGAATATRQVPSFQDDSVLYYGELELRMKGTPDAAAIRELEVGLRAVPHLDVKHAESSQPGMVALKVHAHTPTPLLRIVRSLPVVNDANRVGKDIEASLRPRGNEPVAGST